MSAVNGCYDCNTTCCYDCSLLHDNSYERSWLLPVLIIFAVLFLFGNLGSLLILLGVILLFGKELLEFIF